MRLPFFYGWLVVAVAFVTMAIGVNARTSFSLLFPAILDEFGWERGVTAGAFSLGFVISTLLSPFLGRLMDRFGPRIVIPAGVTAVAVGLAAATQATAPWHLYLTLGGLVVTGTVYLGYTGHALFLPLWFVRRRGLATGLAFAGVGVGSILIFPWLQGLIGRAGWREACWAMAALLLVTLVPLNILLQRRRPEDLGLLPDGGRTRAAGQAQDPADNVVDPAWVAVDWTLGRAVRTTRFWWIFIGFVFGLYAWYAVQVHQTKYLLDIGFKPAEAAFALGFVGFSGVVGQIALGHLSDRVGREWVWTISSAGFILCYLILLALPAHPSAALLYLMVASQGVLGYGLASVFASIPAEIFQGRHYGTIFGTLSLGSGSGAGLGPWVTGLLYDRTGDYVLAFWLAIVASSISAMAMWCAAPRKVRAVAGRARRPATSHA